MVADSKRPRSLNILMVGTVVVLLAGAGILLRPLWQQHGVSFNAQRMGDSLDFDIRLRNAYGLDEFIVFDRVSRETLWSVSLNYFPGPQLSYGKVPKSFRTDNDVINSATQTFPEHDQPAKELIVGKEYVVQIGFIYHDVLDTSGSSCWFALVVEPGGTIRCWRVEPDGNGFR